MALGAIQAIAAHKKTDDIKLIGFDGALETTQAILGGDMQATIAQDPYGMAKVGVEEALDKLDGKPVKKKVDTGAKLITPDNAEKYFEEVRGKLGGPAAGWRARSWRMDARAQVRRWLRPVYHRVLGPLPVDPTRRWPGSATGDDAALRLAFYGDCSMRAMDRSHGVHNTMGWPRVLAERTPLEFSAVFTTLFEWMPGRDDLARHLRLSGDPDVVLVQLGAAYARRTVLPDTSRFLRVREDIGRRLGDRVFAGYRVVRPVTRVLGRERVPYPGPAGLERFLAAVREALAGRPPRCDPAVPTGCTARPSQRAIEARVWDDIRAVCARAGVECLDVSDAAGHDPRLRCANGYNLSAAGAELVGARLAERVIFAAASGSKRPAARNA